MEIPSIAGIALDRVTETLCREVRETAEKIDRFRPLSKTMLRKVIYELLGERVYSSNAIEGNTIELRETIEILKTGHIDVTKRREATEVVNLGKALEFSQGFHAEDIARPDRLLEVHRLLLAGIDDEHAGRFRTQRVMIHGAKYQPPDDRLVEDLMNRVVQQLADELRERRCDFLVLATWFHWALARIHPFFDANGRMARLWQDLILFDGRLTCAIIRPQDRQEYLTALEAADEGSFDPLCQLIAQRVASTLDKYIHAQQQEESLRGWAQQLVGESEARAREERRLVYLRWSRKMEDVRYEFERCAALVTHAASNLEVQLQKYDLIDQLAWENIRAGVGASRTWFFKLVFRRGSRHVAYFFFFGKHSWSDLDPEPERTEPHVGLLISEQLGKQDAVRLDEDGFETPLTIRELFVLDNAVIRRRFDPAAETEVYDRDLTATDIARDFISDVLLSRLPKA